MSDIIPEGAYDVIGCGLLIFGALALVGLGAIAVVLTA